jgi:hypothetical protein
MDITTCCCHAGAAVSGETPEFGCYACPRHRGDNAAPMELCRRHTKVKKADGVINTEDGRTLIYERKWTEDDKRQAKGRIKFGSVDDTIIYYLLKSEEPENYLDRIRDWARSA